MASVGAWLQRHSWVRRLLLAVLACLIFVGGSIVGPWIGDKALTWTWERATARHLYVAVVVSLESVDFTIPEEFLRGFQGGFSGGKEHLETADGTRVTIKTLEDLGSEEEAKRIAEELLADEDCLLVIGNSNSTLTARTLDVFLRSRNPPSYILPIATANELITKAKTAGHQAVLRMVPDNASQAIMIQQLIRELAPSQRVAIYGDQENTVYSLNLSRDIASRVRSNGGSVVIEEFIGPTNSIYGSLAAWQTGRAVPEVIVYVGVAHHGLLLIDQLSQLPIKVPVIFTDGCMVNDLLKNATRLKNRAFVLSPVGVQKAQGQLPTYEPIGRDAFSLASRLIAGCSGCDRASLRSHIAGAKQSFSLENGDAGTYKFNADGNNAAMNYKVYEITGGILQPLAGYQLP